MSVRGTSHAHLERKVINLGAGGTFMLCFWMDCYKDGLQNHSVLQHLHARSIPCDSPLAEHETFIFCTERHKNYFNACSGAMAHDTEARNNGRIAGMLPPGMRHMIQ